MNYWWKLDQFLVWQVCTYCPLNLLQTNQVWSKSYMFTYTRIRLRVVLFERFLVRSWTMVTKIQVANAPWRVADFRGVLEPSRHHDPKSMAFFIEYWVTKASSDPNWGPLSYKPCLSICIRVNLETHKEFGHKSIPDSMLFERL
jgi:hypothetical protein